MTDKLAPGENCNGDLSDKLAISVSADLLASIQAWADYFNQPVDEFLINCTAQFCIDASRKIAAAEYAHAHAGLNQGESYRPVVH